MEENNFIRAIFSKAQTTVDGGWRITFDCGETEAEKITELAKLRGEEILIAVLKEGQT